MNKINDSDQTITVTNLVNDEKMIQKYDELVLATGSSPKELPQLNSEEYNNVFKVKILMMPKQFIIILMTMMFRI